MSEAPIIMLIISVFLVIVVMAMEMPVRSKRSNYDKALLKKAISWNSRKNNGGRHENLAFKDFMREAQEKGWNMNDALIQFCEIAGRHWSPLNDHIKTLLEAGANPNSRTSDGFIVHPDMRLESVKRFGRGKERPAGTRIIRKTPLSQLFAGSPLSSNVMVGRVRRNVKQSDVPISNLLVQYGAEPMDTAAILTSILEGKPANFDWFTRFSDFDQLLLSDPVYIVAIVKATKFSDYFLAYYQAIGGHLDITLPDGEIC